MINGLLSTGTRVQ